MNVKSLTMGLLLIASAPVAMADQFYIDVGADYGDNGFAQAAGNNTTGWLNEMTYVYQSNTVVTDADLNGPDAGDSIITTGGFTDGDISSVSLNQITGFNPSQSVIDPSSPSKNGYGNWGITFQFELFGTLGTGLTTNFTSGNITFYYYDATTPTTGQFLELFTIDISSTQQSVGGPRLTGTITSFGAGSVNGVAVGDVFNFSQGNFDELVDIASSVDFNTDPSQITSQNNGDGTWTLTGQHDGSVSFAVPEPSSLAVVGLGLLGLAGLGRRRKA